MNTMATVSPPIEEAAQAPSEQRFLLRAVDWKTYRAISRALEGRHLRLTYDRGNLEFMTISSTHGNYSRLLGRLIFVLAEEYGLPISSFGDMTCDREDLDRGAEPDECFYLENEPRIRGREEIDLTTDPPPELIVEIDISRSSRNRLSIYAAMGVPEVWQFNGETLRVHQRGADGQYAVSDHSRHFPSLPVGELSAFLHRRTQMDEVSLVRSFRAWVRDHLARNPPTPP
jgi:Uma2 family endonuclease